MTFKKDTKGKNRFSLIPLEALCGVLDVFEYGAQKHGDANWQKCEDPDVYLDAAMRHYFEIRKGNFIDPDSGKNHADHAAANFLIFSQITNKKTAPLREALQRRNDIINAR